MTQKIKTMIRNLKVLENKQQTYNGKISEEVSPTSPGTKSWNRRVVLVDPSDFLMTTQNKGP